jgi:hypothetical protein
MARERNPNDPYYEDPAAKDVRRSTYEDPAANDPRRTSRLDQQREADPVTDNRISGGRIAAAVAAVVVLIGALYYGMNMSSTSPTSTATQTAPASQTDAQNANPAVRDVTPNRDPGTTTGSAPASPQSPASPPSNSSTSPAR